MGKNTTPETYDDALLEGAGQPAQDDVLANEDAILAGLLDLGKSRDEESSYRKIQIKRNGMVKLEFRIRPLNEDETQTCLKNATKYKPSKPGEPKVVIETNRSLFRSYLVYSATVDADRAKVWDNKKAMDALGVMQGVEMVEKILLAGEKDRVLDIVDEISGYDSDMMGTAEN